MNGWLQQDEAFSVQVPTYEETVLWPQDYMPAFRAFKRKFGHMIIPNNYIHSDGTPLGMLVRHLSKGYTTIPDKYCKELVCVLGLRFFAY